ncbi:hypothetical protein SELMODRAFT_405409 [Selaginella moellendorffii]|uniref:Uncharacterized protein n=1 Tax=Selaginella moellendorffii TaxID=88036 RepID=D8QX91_SELML|nr:hypothetical protein SELMODRAFT_405409 [Selaginella moellendorffii]
MAPWHRELEPDSPSSGTLGASSPVNQLVILISRHVDIKLENFSSDLCPLQISVSIRDQVWRSLLASNFYVLKVPLEPFLGSQGIVKIDVSTDQQAPILWWRVFVVDDSGGYHADAVLTGPAPEKCSSQTVDEHESPRRLLPVVALQSQFQRLDLCLPRDEPTCPNSYDSGENFTLSLRDSLLVSSEEEQEDEEELSCACCMLFGYQVLKSWHLASIAVLGAVIHAIILFLRIILSFQQPGHSYLVNEHAAGTWELWTPVSKRGRLARQRNVLASGTGCFDKAWSEAQDLLSSCVHEEGACFTYNCGSHQKSGKWNRDNFGRLTRS